MHFLQTDLRFKLERVCYQSGYNTFGILDTMPYQLACLRPRIGDQECMKDARGNEFCYRFFGRESFDFFTFNGQQRKIPLGSPFAKVDSKTQVEEKCSKLCHDKVGYGDMEMLKGRSLVFAEQSTPHQNKWHPGMNEWSHSAYYPEIDDMCHGCK